MRERFSNDEIELLSIIANSKDPEKAIKIAFDIIQEFLTKYEAK